MTKNNARWRSRLVLYSQLNRLKTYNYIYIHLYILSIRFIQHLHSVDNSDFFIFTMNFIILVMLKVVFIMRCYRTLCFVLLAITLSPLPIIFCLVILVFFLAVPHGKNVIIWLVFFLMFCYTQYVYINRNHNYLIIE